MREGVAVWPTRSERIVGRLSLIRQHRVLFLSWLPYAPGALAPDGVFTPTPADTPPSSPARGAPYTNLVVLSPAACALERSSLLRVRSAVRRCRGAGCLRASSPPMATWTDALMQH